jgi:quercetin dioxygenase-like cupin family protein
MTEEGFTATLTDAGYTQIETKALEARPPNAQHAHDHDVRGLVLGGLFTVWTGDHAVRHETGQVFFVPAGTPHSEDIGPEGARVVIGRRWA